MGRRVSPADTFDGLDLLEKADVGLGAVGLDPDGEDAQRQAAEDLPAEEAQVQHEKLPLEAGGLGLAHVDGVHHAHLRVLAQVVDREAVAVGGDDARNDEQHTPQEHEDVADQRQQNQLSGEGKAVEQREVGHLFAAADTQLVQTVAGAQQHAQQRHDHRDEGDQQRRKGAVQDQERQIHTGGVIYIVYQLLVQRDEIRQAVEQPRDGQKQQREPVGGDAGAFDDVLRLSLQGNTVKQHDAALLSARGI